MNSANSNQTTSRLSTTAEIAAIVIIIVFGLLLAWLLHQGRLEDETQWTRMLVLYNGVEAMAFAAAGALLGTHVRREQVTKAESKADLLQSNLTAAIDRAAGAEAKGRSLRVAIESARPQSALEGDNSAGQQLAQMARKLFPDE